MRTLLAGTNLCLTKSVGGDSKRAIEWFGITLCSCECCTEEPGGVGLWANKTAGIVNSTGWGGGLTGVGVSCLVFGAIETSLDCTKRLGVSDVLREGCKVEQEAVIALQDGVVVICTRATTMLKGEIAAWEGAGTL